MTSDRVQSILVADHHNRPKRRDLYEKVVQGSSFPGIRGVVQAHIESVRLQRLQLLHPEIFSLQKRFSDLFFRHIAIVNGFNDDEFAVSVKIMVRKEKVLVKGDGIRFLCIIPVLVDPFVHCL